MLGDTVVCMHRLKGTLKNLGRFLLSVHIARSSFQLHNTNKLFMAGTLGCSHM